MTRKSKSSGETVRLPDIGLAAILANVRKKEYGIVADWIEDHLRNYELAEFLRAGGDDPRTPAQRDQTVFSEFRYRLLDGYVLLFAAHFKVCQWTRNGEEKDAPQGHVIGLCLSANAPNGPTRLVRWLLKDVPCPGLDRLWQELSKEPAPSALEVSK